MRLDGLLYDLRWVSLPDDKYATPETRNAFFDLLGARLMGVPGVEAQSIASTAPVNIPGSQRFDVDGAVYSCFATRCHFPARRAMRADPLVALRHD